MMNTSERYRRVAEAFTARAEAVPAGGWEASSPCEGWTARDVVRHVVDGSASFLARAGVEAPEGPSVDADPVGAWTVARDAIQAALDDPEVASQEFDSGMGPTTLDRFVGMFGVADVLVHTWDLSRAMGQAETLDPEEVTRIYAMMEPNDEMMRQGTAFGPRVAVSDGADEQTRLIAFTGRKP